MSAKKELRKLAGAILQREAQREIVKELDEKMKAHPGKEKYEAAEARVKAKNGGMITREGGRWKYFITSARVIEEIQGKAAKWDATEYAELRRRRAKAMALEQEAHRALLQIAHHSAVVS